jgi:hypothetical protein
MSTERNGSLVPMRQRIEEFINVLQGDIVLAFEKLDPNVQTRFLAANARRTWQVLRLRSTIRRKRLCLAICTENHLGKGWGEHFHRHTSHRIRLFKLIRPFHIGLLRPRVGPSKQWGL